ncbi:L-rhamnose-binding lectin CSL1-like [Saccostrea cucullata]|uniref:L-rhamnose-binding lectin CSL1-like n=1 Tax=Saccostrea cuccullata TaxID=36930 RepID=UPI002ECFE089
MDDKRSSAAATVSIQRFRAFLCVGISGFVFYNPTSAIQERSALVCENSLLTLDCEKKTGVIRISKANYGRLNLGTCNSLGTIEGWNLRCIQPNSKGIVAERCDGHPKCSITASSEVFGDPCVNTFKYLQVYYRCEPRTPPYTTESTTGTTTTRKAITTTPLRRVCDAVYIEGKNWPYTNVGDVASMKCPPPKVGTVTWRCTGRGWLGERPDDSKCELPVTESPSGETTTQKIRFCEMTVSQGIIWPQVRVGKEVERPCPEGKLGKVTWKCTGAGWQGERPDESMCQLPIRAPIVCENSVLTLDCEKKKGIIRISEANYGRINLGTCKSQNTTDEDVRCIHPESKRIVAERCDGHPECNITASSEVFGDPCVNTSKYLQVNYSCEPRSKHTVTYFE